MKMQQEKRADPQYSLSSAAHTARKTRTTAVALSKTQEKRLPAESTTEKWEDCEST